MTRFALIIRIAIVFLVCVLLLLGLLGPLLSVIGDYRYDVLRRPPTGQILLVDIDEPSIRAVGTWPWSRSIHAAIVDRLRALHAADIAFDVDFSSPSTPEGDAAFEAALKRAGGSVILAALQQATSESGEATTMIASRPLDRFASNAWEGSVDVRPDPDQRIRWLSRQETFGLTQLPSLAFLLGSGAGEAGGRFAIDYGIDAGRLSHVSVAAILAGTADPRLIEGRSVIVGASAVELRDYFQVPRFGLMAGSVVQAMAAESLLQGRALQLTSTPATLVLTCLVLGLVGLGGRRLPFARFLALCLGAAVLVEVAALWAQSVRPVIPNTAPVHVGLIAFVLTAVSSEIAERRVKLLAARRGANRLRVILDRVIADNFAGIVVVDQDEIVRAVSGAAVTILGSGAASGSGRRFQEVLPKPLAHAVVQALAHAQSHASFPSHTCDLQVAIDGAAPLTLDCVTTVSDIVKRPANARRGGTAEFVVCLTFRDVTDERTAQIRLAEMARVDVLSGLANRFVLLERLAEVHPQGIERCDALVLFDLDRFKLVNDRLGHTAGDALIRAVADLVRTLVAPGDTVARLGGDEFALVVGRASPADIRGLAEAVVSLLGRSYEIGDYLVSMTVSVGFALAEGQDSTHLMGCADAALYAAKMAGGNRSRFFDEAMRAALDDGKIMEDELRQALQRGELEVFYQRQVDTEEELIVGVEALVRWRHPERGYISPDRFIPVAERTGLIEALGRWVLATACKDAVSWPLPIKVSVNLSAVQLARADLADTVLNTLAHAGLDPERLDLELTESLLVDNDALVRATLGRLRASGIKISLDDFGTGYSSLSYLKSFAIDKVKIDQSFVRDLPNDHHSAAVIRAVVGLARDLGLRVNAEGVETNEQLKLLHRLGCDEVQGYLHGKPEPSLAIWASLTHQQSSTEEGRKVAGRAHTTDGPGQAALRHCRSSGT